MKVLFIAGACPYPPDSGGTVRTYNLLKRVCTRHDITLIAPERPGVDLAEVFDGRLRGKITVPVQGRTLAHTLRAMASPLPYIVKAHESAAMSAAVREALSTERYDLLHCDSISVVPTVPVNAAVPKTFNAHNIEAVIWERYVREERRPWMLPMLRAQLAKVRAYESYLRRIFDVCVAVCDQDRDAMKRSGFREARTVSNGVDLEYYTPLPPASERRLVFTGSLDWRPNQDALRWFAREIWPLVRLEAPEAAMSIVGRKPPRWVKDLCKASDMQLSADVPDVRPYLAEAAVVVVPLRIGGGSRLKILEAMAAGRCVVSTSIGAEGLEVRHGEQLLVADSPAVFAQAVLSVLDDWGLGGEMARAGRALVEARYGWDSIALDLEEAWRCCHDSYTAACLQRSNSPAGPARRYP